MPVTPFLEQIHKTPLVFDGAMGTALYSEGVFVNRCFDEISLTAPDLVKRIHTAYVEAGADVIETNTYGANTPHLMGYGLADRLPDIIAAACRLAREAAGDAVYVAGSVGPCQPDVSMPTEEKRQHAADAYREVVGLLDRQGVDLLMLETFSDLDEALLAAATGRSSSRSWSMPTAKHARAPPSRRSSADWTPPRRWTASGSTAGLDRPSSTMLSSGPSASPPSPSSPCPMPVSPRR